MWRAANMSVQYAGQSMKFHVYMNFHSLDMKFIYNTGTVTFKTILLSSWHCDYVYPASFTVSTYVRTASYLLVWGITLYLPVWGPIYVCLCVCCFMSTSMGPTFIHQCGDCIMAMCVRGACVYLRGDRLRVYLYGGCIMSTCVWAVRLSPITNFTSQHQVILATLSYLGASIPPACPPSPTLSRFELQLFN